jgi:hypothetical protein
MPDDTELEIDFKQGAEMLMSQGSMIALFPIEKWLADLQRADAIAPILDPTLYRDYIYSGRDEMLKSVLSAALGFKRAIVKAQQDVTAGKVR